MRDFGRATALIEEVPEIEFDGPHIIFTGSGQRWAYRRETAVKTFAHFAEKLREQRLSGAEIIQLFPADRHAASS